MKKHTPGRWVIADRQYLGYAIVASEATLDRGRYPEIRRGRGYDPYTIALVYDNASVPHPAGAEAEANARLIVAAPDLLAALEELLDLSLRDFADNTPRFHAARLKGRAALAKARGEEPPSADPFGPVPDPPAGEDSGTWGAPGPEGWADGEGFEEQD